MKLTRTLASILLATLALSACGQKGPLYLPGDPNQVRSEVPTTNSSTAPDEDDQEEQDEQQP
ncbi:LPS translocon maturation chaperone LptM [Woeseia oceani]|uniref:Lipoprotein n=1 Tax=Woeseia oceani TaxID=1548547 RepID=A0A193LCB4_9GAMM|nr:lipoprotein [Woeseia oceani]ANO50175.1 hypothetical protein BA177_02120 [Woeseia oceani]